MAYTEIVLPMRGLDKQYYPSQDLVSTPLLDLAQIYEVKFIF